MLDLERDKFVMEVVGLWEQDCGAVGARFQMIGEDEVSSPRSECKVSAIGQRSPWQSQTSQPLPINFNDIPPIPMDLVVPGIFWKSRHCPGLVDSMRDFQRGGGGGE